MSHESFERVEIVEGPSNRSFGFVFAAVFSAIGFISLFSSKGVLIWAFVAGAAFALAAIVIPVVLTPLNRLWLKFGILLHKIVSPIVLAIMFFVVITPIGIVMRLVGKDPLRLRLDKNTNSYWIERIPPGPAPESLKDQF